MSEFDFLGYVREAVADAASTEQRYGIYRRLQTGLRESCEAKGYSLADYSAWAAQLDKAIQHVEDEFGATQSRPLPPLPAAPANAQPVTAPRRDAVAEETDRGAVEGFLRGIDAKYGLLAVFIPFLNDFIKPIVDLGPAAIGASAILGIALVGYARFAKKNRRELKTLGACCGIIFVLSGALATAQIFVPGASANGVTAQLVPGVGNVQDAMLSSLGRIEQQTKRVGDLLEDNVRQQKADRERAERQAREGEAKQKQFEAQRRQAEAQQLEEARQKIRAAGLEVSPRGLMDAAQKNDHRLIGYFRGLDITLTPEAVSKYLAEMEGPVGPSGLPAGPGGLTSYLSNQGNATELGIQRAIASERDRLAATFRKSRAQSTICNPPAKTIVIAAKALREVCAADGIQFAIKFTEYFRKFWLLAGAGTGPVTIYAGDYLKENPEELPATTVSGPMSFMKLEPCKYYRGVLSFWIVAKPFLVEDAGTILADRPGYVVNNSNKFAFFDNASRPALAGKCSPDKITRSDQQCRAEVIAVSHCDSHLNAGVLKVIRQL